MTTAQRWLLAVVAACAAVACFAGAVFTCAGCSPAADATIVRDDVALMPYTGLACTIAAEATGDNPIVTLVCDAVKGAEGVIAQLPVPDSGAPATITAQAAHVVLRVPASQLPGVLAKVTLVVPDAGASLAAAASVVQAVTGDAGGQ